LILSCAGAYIATLFVLKASLEGIEIEELDVVTEGKIDLKSLLKWIKRHRHKPIKELNHSFYQKLQGHYCYYGITFNYRALSCCHERVMRMPHKWLNRQEVNELLYPEAIFGAILKWN